MNEFHQYLSNFWEAIPHFLGGLFLAFVITYLAIPSIGTVADLEHLHSMPNGRTTHTKAVLLSRAIVIFAGLIIVTIIFSALGFGWELKYIVAGLIIQFFVRIKDDTLTLDAKKKLASQILAVLLIAVLGCVFITHFHGMFGIEEVNYVVSSSITVFFLIVLTNGFNLIDGIDGLASGVGIITSLPFSCWFLMFGHTSYAIMTFALIGALLALFYYNVFGKHNKIFLGVHPWKCLS